jgi:Ca2+-binding RTX toxin-like protein
MQAKRVRSSWAVCGLTLGLLACGKSGGDAAGGGAAGAPADGTSGAPGAAAGHSAYSGAGTGGASASAVTPDFEGIPNGNIPYGMAPAGCTDAAQSGNTADTLVLTLDSMLKTVLLSGNAGSLQVNGVTCTAVPSPKLVKVVGSSASDVIVVDFSLGELPASLKSGSIQIDGGAGTNKDTVAVAATREGDEVHLGTQSGADGISLGTGFPLLKISGAETLILSTGPGSDRVDATGGSNLGSPLASGVIVYGGADDDVLQGGAGADTLHGGDGDDLFETAAKSDGGDSYDGGAGDDSLSYEKRTQPVTIKVDKQANDGEANERDDVQDSVETLIGGDGADNITAGDNDNTLIGGPGNDTLNGGNGNDTFMETTTAKGADIMNGGPGVDSVNYSERSGDLSISLCIAAQASCIAGQCGCTGDDGEHGEKDVLVNVENATGGRGNDEITGSAADNVLIGNEGNDMLSGLAGDDTEYGGDGDDSLWGGPGDDTLYGNAGKDYFEGGDGQGDICIVSVAESYANCELH